MNTNKVHVIYLKLDTALYTKISQEAQGLGLSRAGYIRMILNRRRELSL